MTRKSKRGGGGSGRGAWGGGGGGAWGGGGGRSRGGPVADPKPAPAPPAPPAPPADGATDAPPAPVVDPRVERAKEELRAKIDEFLAKDEAWGMHEPVATVMTDEYYMGYECFSQDIICEDGSEQARLWTEINPDARPSTHPALQDKAFLPPLYEMNAVIKHCDELQLRAVKIIVEKARQESFATYDKLLKRVIGMGYTEPQLRRTLVYIRDEAPIIIQVHLDQNDRLQKMINDTHYRNQFEVKMSNGSYESNHSSRRGWEDRLFHTVYNDAQPFQRPKYGVINITSDPVGVKCAHGYGSSHFITRGTRLRTSFTEKDSCNADVSMSCCEHYNQVLFKYSDGELRGVMEVANNKVAFVDSSCIANYKEVQLHGAIPLNECIERVVVDEKHRGDEKILKLLKEFCAKNNCSYIFTGDYKTELEENFEKRKALMAALESAQ